MLERTYEVNNSKITLRFGDITTSRSEILVSSDDFLLSMGGGVSAAIREAAGYSVKVDARKMVPAQAGDVVVTSAGDLPAKYIFHAITIGRENDLPSDTIVRQATQRAMRLLPRLGCTTIAFPAIGTGVAGIPYATAAAEMAGAIVESLLDSSNKYSVELYLQDRNGRVKGVDWFSFFEAFAAARLGLTNVQDNSLRPPVESAISEEDLKDSKRRQQVYLMLRHLDIRRNQLEANLLKSMSQTDADEGSLSKTRRQLDEIHLLRKNYEAEFASASGNGGSTVPKSVFVSSTSLDLKPHRQAVRDVIKNLDLTFIGMEEFIPSAKTPADLIRQKVIESRVYIGILGLRYGAVDASTGLSMTELEYRQAVASNKPICMFILDKDAPIFANMVEDDPERFAKLLEFRKHVMQSHTCALFNGPIDLAQKTEATLKESSVAVRHE